ncbi:MAG: DUF1648 domain-containing protein [Armatimonadota bacterium]
MHNWQFMPHKIPNHFDFRGTPDGWGSRMDLVFLVSIAVACYVSLTVLNRFPHVFNHPVPITEENALRQYAIATSAVRWLKLEIVSFVVYAEWGTIETALGRAHGLGPLSAPILLVAMFATMALLLMRGYRAR